MSTLAGAYDLHVHCGPDVVPRAQDAFDLARDAHAAGMLGIGLKDHTTSTIGRARMLNRLYPAGPRFYSSLVLNPPVGGVNPAAVESALQAGVDMIYFPTYAARHHLDILGADVTPVPQPSTGVIPLSVQDPAGELTSATRTIVKMIAQHDAVLATGHLSPRESLALLEYAQAQGVSRMVVTHASESVPNMCIEDQRIATEFGAKIEHSLLAVTPCCPGTIELSVIRDQIMAVGVAHCLISSDFGQVANGPPVQALSKYVEQLAGLGFGGEQMRVMLVDNPKSLVDGRRDSPRSIE